MVGGHGRGHDRRGGHGGHGPEGRARGGRGRQPGHGRGGEGQGRRRRRHGRDGEGRDLLDEFDVGDGLGLHRFLDVEGGGGVDVRVPVSYAHLTLPTT
ncbi:hypothetical protein D7X96_30185 [Corallococcus interemptor]|uniref:Uncharacterized protein n=1 Tax=Corallococcus interemptor TaxID=2316720 RepID=A0A3A8Q099_9BACT|nr:hypothetical protein D7X96_30185 [Corallococcus interemptor]